MGFLRRLFGYNKKQPNQVSAESKERRRWGFARSSYATPSQPTNNRWAVLNPYDGALDANKHAIAVAAATAAVAEAALAAAQAAAEVVRLTSSNGGVRSASSAGCNRTRKEKLAAVKIQSAFRAYLARRALRALKALVKLQALVRGHIVRKQTADMLRRMQTLVKVQARARASRAYVSESLDFTNESSRSIWKVPDSHDNDDNDDHRLCACSTKFDGSSILKRCGSNSISRDLSNLEKARSDANWLEHWMEETLWSEHRDPQLGNQHADDEKCDKILEVDTWKPHLKSQQSNRIFHTSDSISNYTNQSFMTVDSPSKLSMKAQNRVTSLHPAESLLLSSLKFPTGKEEVAVRTAENSPQMFSALSKPGSSNARRGPFTPTRSECSWGFFNGYSGHPNYMANTESSRAKVRSQSAPRQRLEFEKHGSTRRSLQGLWETTSNSERVFPQHTDCRSRAYPASGHPSRLWSSYMR